MKITIDKKLTSLEYAPKVKADIKEFKEMWGNDENAIIKYFLDEVGESKKIRYDSILKCDIEAFPAGFFYDNITSYSFNVVVESFYYIYKIRFYMHHDGYIGKTSAEFGDKLYTIRKYKAEY